MMNKNDLIVAASKKSGITQRQMRECAIPFLESLAEALTNGENVYIEGLGSFTIKERKEPLVWEFINSSIGEGNNIPSANASVSVQV